MSGRTDASVKVKVMSAHRITVPKHFRDKYDISEGDHVYMTPPEDPNYENVSEEEMEELEQMADELF